MTREELKKKALEYDWEEWLPRPFDAFMLSLFIGGNSRETMLKIGVNVEHPISLYENAWCESIKVYEEVNEEFRREIPRGLNIIKVSEGCEKYRVDGRKKIKELIENKSKSPRQKLQKVFELLKLDVAYIWLAHDFEYYYTPILKAEISRHFKRDADEIMGDISFPEKKNSHNFLVEELLADIDSKKLVKKFGWINARDGFADPFSIKDLEEMRDKIRSEKKTPPSEVRVPAEMKTLVAEVRELVYFRTLRTDVFYELLFLARPITEAVGKEYGLAFKELRDYTIQDLIVGKPVKYPEKLTCVYYKNEAAFFTEPILPKQQLKNFDVKGTIAFKGKASGVARIVLVITELNRVRHGDILVTHMTSPNFLPAMQRAAAFITDEGGITCHAAIIAREMKKPCIIGTKIATQVLKDGDMVEVDAEKGVVKIIKRA